MDKLALRDSIAFSNPADLTFADGMHRLRALNGRRLPRNRRRQIDVVRAGAGRVKAIVSQLFLGS